MQPFAGNHFLWNFVKGQGSVPTATCCSLVPTGVIGASLNVEFGNLLHPVLGTPECLPMDFGPRHPGRTTLFPIFSTACAALMRTTIGNHPVPPEPVARMMRPRVPYHRAKILRRNDENHSCMRRWRRHNPEDRNDNFAFHFISLSSSSTLSLRLGTP